MDSLKENKEPNREMTCDVAQAATILHFWFNLKPELVLYIQKLSKREELGIKKHAFEMTREQKVEHFKAWVDILGIDAYVNTFVFKSESEKSQIISEGKEILSRGANDELYEWSNKIEDNIENMDDLYNLMTSFPPIQQQNISNQESKDFATIFKYFVESNKDKYIDWNQSPLDKQVATTPGTYQFWFFMYDMIFKGDFYRRMFFAMNSDTSDTHLNKEIVEAVKAYSDPHFAEQVDMHYKEYKRYCSQRCAEFPFVDPVAEPKQQQVLQSNKTAAPGQKSIKARLGDLLKTSLLKDDVSALFDCFYKVLKDPDRDALTIKGDLIYYLSMDSKDEEGHCGVHWPGSRESLAFFIQKVLPGKKSKFWKNAYKVFMVKQDGKWSETSSLNTIGPREWVKIEEDCDNMEQCFNNWMNGRPKLKGQWEIGDWRKSKSKHKKS